MPLSVPELASRLGVSESRARLLVRSGRIHAQRVGGVWVIDEADAVKYQPGASAGRPLSERSAWLFALYFDVGFPEGPGAEALHLPAIDKHRLKRRRQRLQEASDPLSLIRSLMARRAETAEYSSNPADLSGLREDSRVHLSGVSHPDAGLRSNSEVEAYVSRKDLESLIKDWFLVQPRPGLRANVILHVAEKIPEELPPLVIAADLADRPGVREQEAARSIIRGIQAGKC